MNAFTDGLGAGIGAAVGFGLINALMGAQPPGQQPLWAGEVNETMLVVMQKTSRTATGYHLYAITPEGGCVFAGAVPGIPQMLAMVRQWQRYLTEGGSVQAWLAHHSPQMAAPQRAITPKKEMLPATSRR